MDPAVSIVIPTYQRRELVQQAVASVLAQTRADFEVIVIDDGSTDGTGEVLAGVDARVRYVWQPNRGVAAARNVGLRLARAPIIAFLDSDNRWLPDHLEILTAALDRVPEAVLVTTCPRGVVAGRQGVERTRLLEAPPETSGNVGLVSCVGVRRSALEAVGGFDERLRAGEDADLWLRLSLRGPFGLLQRRTVVRRTTPGSLNEWGFRSGAYLDARETSMRRAIHELEHGETAPARAILDSLRGQLQFVAALRALPGGEDDRVGEALRQACRLLPELANRPVYVFRSVAMVPTRALTERGRHAATIASRWPDPRADSALLLRGWAILIALRVGRVRQAATLLRGWPVTSTPRALARLVPIVARRLRRTVSDALHSG